MKFNLLNKNKGFTLVEIIVSLGIFAVVALVAMGALMKVMDANRKSLSLKTSINNLNFALESMTREIRMGKNYSCSNNISALDFNSSNKLTMVNNCLEVNYINFISSPIDWYFAFNSARKDGNCNLINAYKYDSANNTLLKAEQISCLTAIPSFQPLISDQITIDTAAIELNNDSQPRAFIYVSGTSGVKAKDKTQFSLQTTISQRLPK